TGTALLDVGQPFQASRPKGQVQHAHHHHVGQDVEARLWQDPLSVIARANERLPTTAHSGAPGSGSSESDDHSETALGKTLKKGDEILAVTVSGSPYPETEEHRRRVRYAVLAALNVEGYAPKEEEHIGYFRPVAKKADLPTYIPFEWF